MSDQSQDLAWREAPVAWAEDDAYARWVAALEQRPFEPEAAIACYLRAIEAAEAAPSAAPLELGVVLSSLSGVALSVDAARFWLLALTDLEAMFGVELAARVARLNALLACDEIDEAAMARRLTALLPRLSSRRFLVSFAKAIAAPLRVCFGYSGALLLMVRALSSDLWATCVIALGAMDPQEQPEVERALTAFLRAPQLPSIQDCSSEWMWGLYALIKLSGDDELILDAFTRLQRYQGSRTQCFVLVELLLAMKDIPRARAQLDGLPRILSGQQLLALVAKLGAGVAPTLVRRMRAKYKPDELAQLLEVLMGVRSCHIAEVFFELDALRGCDPLLQRYAALYPELYTLGMLKLVQRRGKRQSFALMRLRQLVSEDEQGARLLARGLEVLDDPKVKALVEAHVLIVAPLAALSKAPAQAWMEALAALEPQAWLDELIAWPKLPPLLLADGVSEAPLQTQRQLLWACAMLHFKRAKLDPSTWPITKPRTNAQRLACAQLGALREVLEPRSAGRWAWAVFAQWLSMWRWRERHDWALMILGYMGGAPQVMGLEPYLRQHKRLLYDQGGAHASVLMDALALIGTPEAWALLRDLAARIAGSRLKQVAAKHLLEARVRLGLDEPSFEDLLVPTCGLDPSGDRAFSYGQRRFLVTLVGRGQLEIIDAQGKRYARLPPKRKTDDPARATRAAHDFKQLRAQLELIFTREARRLERALIAQRRWRLEGFWRDLYTHPVLKFLVCSLVWRLHSPDRAGDVIFLPCLDGSWVDAQLDVVALPDEAELARATVTLVHPISLEADQRAAWTEVLLDAELVQPFAQLSRELYGYQEDEREGQLREALLKLPSAGSAARELMGDIHGLWDDGREVYAPTLTYEIGPLRVYLNLDPDHWERQPGLELRGSPGYVPGVRQLLVFLRDAPLSASGVLPLSVLSPVDFSELARLIMAAARS